MGDQQLGGHKVPLLASVQRHLEKDGSPIFFGLTVRHGRLRDTTRRPYKASAREVCSSRLYGSLRIAGLFCCRSRGKWVGEGQADYAGSGLRPREPRAARRRR